MDPRLEEASVTGNLGLLHQLLHENRFLLDTTTLYSVDNPVHIAASLGHASFIHEIIIRKPRLAGELNSQGLSPLHLAAANGHVDAVRELVKSSSDLCLVRSYKEGMMPIHVAAAKGRTGVLGELMDACSASVKAASHRGETVFYLAVASGCLEAVKLVMDKTGDDTGGDMLKMRDDKGNTALHIAVARKQFQVVKLLLSKSGLTDVNVTNIKGFTPLDVLLESPSEHGDLALGELIWAAGGRTATEADTPASAPASLTTTHRPGRIVVEEDHSNYQNTPGTLMVVATLIATITFQAGMNPPGGFMQANVSTSTITGQRRRRDGRPSKGEAQALPFAGQAVLGDNLTWFLIFDVVGLFASLSIILLLICVIPSRKKMVMGVLVWVMWVAVFCTALAFQSAIVLIYEEEDDMVIGVLANAWFGLLRVTVVWISIRFVVYLLRWAGWMKKKGRQEAESSTRVRRGVMVVIRRMLAVVLIVAVVAATCYVNFKLQSWIN